MARTAQRLPTGAQITEKLALSVLLRAVPRRVIDEVLVSTGRQGQRERDLPAHVMVYYCIAMALFMPVAYREVLRWLFEGMEPLGTTAAPRTVATKSSISRARGRLGAAPMRELFARLVHPVAAKGSPGAWYRQWRLVSIDGTTLDLPDTPENEATFGRPPASRGRSAFPQVRLLGLVECASHVLFHLAFGPYRVGETTLAATVFNGLTPEMLCLADRGFFTYHKWLQATATGAALVWRLTRTIKMPVLERYPDGSYRSVIYADRVARRLQRGGISVRVIEYKLPGVADAEPIYRLITNLLDCQQAPAKELIACYLQRWEIELTFDELKTHLRGGQVVLRSKLPALVEQEIYSLVVAHFAVRGLMQEAAEAAHIDPDRLSYIHAVRVIRRRLPAFAALPPSGPGAVAPAAPQ